MFRKEEAAVTDWSPETVQMCARRQLEILRCAAAMLRPGGRLVYSTCTFAPAENEGVISKFLEENREFSVKTVQAPWFAPGQPDWVDHPADGIAETFRLWPHRLRGEGHYAAVLERSVQADVAASDPGTPDYALRQPLLEAFCRETAVRYPEGKLIAFGKSLYVVPEEMPQLRGLKVLRPGLELGQILKNRFEPAHAWALWLKEAGQCADFAEDSPEIAAYLRGETLPGNQSGWTLVQVDGLSLGWCKGSGGVLKNHFPKALRRLG